MQVDYAFHSGQMTTLAQRFGKELGRISSTRPATPMFSTLTGAALDRAVDVDYFAKAIHEPVRFADAIAAMRRTGVDAIVEIGPHPALAAAISETLDFDPPRVIVASLHRARDEAETIRAGLAALYRAGLDPNWEGVQPGVGSVVSLPAYPWRRRRLWVKAARRTTTQSRRVDWIGAPRAVAGAGLTIVPLEPSVSAEWMEDHRLFGATLFPAAAMIHAMTRAAHTASRGRFSGLEDFVIRRPLRVEHEDDEWQVVVADGGATSFYARISAVAEWRLIAEARAVAVAQPAAPAVERAGDAVDLAAFYDRMAAKGVAFGPAFQRLIKATRCGLGAAAYAVLPDQIEAPAMLHPTLLDAGLQLVSVACRPDGIFLPLSIDRLWLHAAPCPAVELTVRIASRSATSISADILAHSETGVLVAALEGVNLVKTSAATLQAVGQAADVHEVEWAPLASSEPAPRSWLVLDDAYGVGTALEALLSAVGLNVVRLAHSTTKDVLAASADATICLPLADGFRRKRDRRGLRPSAQAAPWARPRRPSHPRPGRPGRTACCGPFCLGQRRRRSSIPSSALGRSWSIRSPDRKPPPRPCSARCRPKRRPLFAFRATKCLHRACVRRSRFPAGRRRSSNRGRASTA